MEAQAALVWLIQLAALPFTTPVEAGAVLSA